MPDAPKNIIYIMLDDADFFDFSFVEYLLDPGEGDAVTPHIDFLRDQGTLFTNFYSASAICSPTRISVLTGDNPLEYGAVDVRPNDDFLLQGSRGNNGLPDDVPQLGLLMQSMGLATGHFGKWHVGLSRLEYGPANLGFDQFTYHQNIEDVTDFTNWNGIYEFVSEDGSVIQDVDYIDTHFADEILDFLSDQVAADNPFFLNWWPLSPHFPWAPPENFDNSATNFDLNTTRGNVLAMMYAIDQEIGRVISFLEDNGQLDDTLIVVTSDNGGAGPAQNPDGSLNGTKGTLLEGGIRVPLVAFWPGGIEAGGTNESVVTTSDLLPTFFDILGGNPATLHGEISGRSKADAFLNDVELDHDPITWQIGITPTIQADPRAQGSFAYRFDDYKLIKLEGRSYLNDSAYWLFNLGDDPGEANELHLQEAEIADALEALVNAARIDLSNADIVPETSNGAVLLPFDPRLDAAGSNMTLRLTIDVPAIVSGNMNIYAHAGAQAVQLLADGSIRWTVIAADEDGGQHIIALRSGVLTAGQHDVMVTIGNVQTNAFDLELYIDGQLADSVLEGRLAGAPQAVWSSTGDITLGDIGLQLTEISYHNIRFFPDQFDALANPVENSVFGYQGDDSLFGTLANNHIYGGQGDDYVFAASGSDTLFGGAGNDILIGGIGADMMTGGIGDDIYFVDDIGDAVNENAGEGIDEVRSLVDYTLGENVENLRLQLNALSGTGNDLDNQIFAGRGPAELSGLGGNDVIYGSADVDMISGGTGNDTLYGRPGNDTIDGGAGDDLLNGQANSDTLNGGDGNDILIGGDGQDILNGDNGNDTLRGGALLDQLNGGAGMDVLFGDAGNDVLVGGDGVDRLTGGAGRDFLTGGNEKDFFTFSSVTDFSGITATTSDRIFDFDQGQGDLIRLDQIDAITGGGDDAFVFVGTDAFSGMAGELRYEQGGAFTLVQGDIDGDGTADFAIRLDGLHNLVSSDFQL